MWTRLDDALIDHRKVFAAGEAIGRRNGPALAIAMHTIGLLWSNRQLSDGFLPIGVVKAFAHFDKPLAVADALVAAGLWETAAGGFVIHDYHEYNQTATAAKARRDSIRTARAKAGTNGARVRWNHHK